MLNISKFIFVTNFEKQLFKIYAEQLIEKLFILKSSIKLIQINFNIIDVFIEKYDVKSDIFYIINFLNKFSIKKIEISKY